MITLFIKQFNVFYIFYYFSILIFCFYLNNVESGSKAIIAYEPVWAISQGKDFSKHKGATPDDAAVAQAVIRKNLKEMYGEECAQRAQILYGGSAKADNTAAFLKTEGIDGLLPGGASLSMATFWPMVEKASQLVATTIEVN